MFGIEYWLFVGILNEELSSKAFTFDYSMIKEIVINPWLPGPVFPSVEKIIRSVCPNATFEIRRTTMLANDVFMKAGGE